MTKRFLSGINLTWNLAKGQPQVVYPTCLTLVLIITSYPKLNVHCLRDILLRKDCDHSSTQLEMITLCHHKT